MGGGGGIAAAACLAAILLVSGCSRESAVPYRELRDEDPRVRMDAALRIGQAKPEDAVEALTSLLDDPDEFVRIQAAESLGLLETPAALPSLVVAAEDPLGTVRLAAFKGLGRLKDAAGVPALQKGLYEEDETLRVAAAKALAEIPGDESLSALLSVAMQDEYEQVRELVVRVIGQRRVREAVPKLEGMLGAESDLVRANAALILRGLSDASSVPALLRALDDPYYKVRSLAAHALATVAPDDPEVLASLREALQGEEVAITRVDLAWSLARCGDRSGMPVLREQLFRGNPEDVRAEAALALGEVGEAQDTPLLERAIQDKKGLVRSAAFKSLEKLKGRNS
jgi:HEAT repeat protein